MASRKRATPAASTRSGGFVLVYILIAIVVLSAGGVTLTNIATSANTSQTSLLQTLNARYLAESGVLYAKGVIASYESQAKTVAEAVTALNANSGTVTVTGVGSFVITATNSGSTITIVSKGIAKSGMSTIQIPQTTSVTYTPTSSGASSSDALKGTYSGVSAIISGVYSGNVTTSSATISGGTIVTGSVNYLGTGSTCLDISGGALVGSTTDPAYICSDSCVVVRGGASVYGDIYSQGDVTISANVYGDVHAGGNVTLQWGANVWGNIYAHGTFSQPNYFSGLHGTVTTGAAAPALCSSYTLPAHQTVSSSTDLVITTGDVTFSGKASLTDTTYSYKSISTGWGTRICFDLSDPNKPYINIWNKGDFVSNSSIYVRTPTSPPCFDLANLVSSTLFSRYAYASRVYMDVGGTVRFGGSRGWFGTVYAAGNIYPSSGGFNIGAFYTNKSYNPENAWTTTRFVLSDYVANYWP